MGGKLFPDGTSIELGEERNAGAGVECASEDVDDAMHMMERQRVQNVVRLHPLPALDERAALRVDHAVREDDALGLARGATGVDEHRAPGRRQLEEVDVRFSDELQSKGRGRGRGRGRG